MSRPIATFSVDGFVEVSYTHVVNLLRHYWSNTYVTDQHSDTDDDILNLVELLWAMDYSCLEISNKKGELCPHYPIRIFVPDAHMESSMVDRIGTRSSKDLYDDQLKVCVPKISRSRIFREEYDVLGVKFQGNLNNSQEFSCLAIKTLYTSIECVSPLHSSHPEDGQEYFVSIGERKEKLQTLMNKTHYARSRNRVIVPVILYKGMYVTRSATIALPGEFYARLASDLVCSIVKTMSFQPLYDLSKSDNVVQREAAREALSGIDLARADDVALLNHVKINTIFDLMVEEKKVCYGFYTASSEKATKKEETNHYSHMSINQVPYPGCEFFAKFGKVLHAEKLHFDWTAHQVNSELHLESEHLKKFEVPDYKTWSLDYLTKHYLMIMLTDLKRGEGGFLVHCISGWDRTPLFVSLLRISLWADGEVHQSCSPVQMLYFTLAYDWMFFCHDMKKRTGSDELVLFFCFYFLKFIKGENFNITSDHFGRKIKENEYIDGFEMISRSRENSPETFMTEEIFNMSMSPNNLATNVPNPRRRDSDEFHAIGEEGWELPKSVTEDQTLATKLTGRGMSSPTVPGAHMSGIPTTNLRKLKSRHEKITTETEPLRKSTYRPMREIGRTLHIDDVKIAYENKRLVPQLITNTKAAQLRHKSVLWFAPVAKNSGNNFFGNATFIVNWTTLFEKFGPNLYVIDQYISSVKGYTRVLVTRKNLQGFEDG